VGVPAGTLLGPYEIGAPLGVGGMGEVYRARDTRLGRDVAIKVLPESFANDPDRVKRFEREAVVLASLNHPHIAQIHGLEHAGALALVMELVEGEDLAARIARGPLPPDEAFAIATQIAEALEAAHEAGIVHRDLKPANIKVRSDGTVKVLDFGLAKPDSPGAHGALGATITSPALTVHGVILGTAAYMSPEQAKGKAVDRRADVWAFGCVLYEMLTGRRAFEGDDITETIVAVVSKAPDWSALPASTPASVERLLRRCLEKPVAKRLPHLGVARLELDDAQAARPERGTLPPPSRGGIIAAATLVGAAIGAAAAYVALRGTAPADIVPQAPMQLAVPMPSATTAANGILLSPDGRLLVTIGPGGLTTLHAFDGSASRTLEGSAGCWSPDSRSLVLHSPSGDLVRMDLAGGPAVAFAKGPGTGAGCAWNRDGLLVIGGGPSPFQRVGISGGTPANIEIDDGGDGTIRLFPKFLPDGRRFLYWAQAPDGQRTVRVGSLDSRLSTRIVESDAPAAYSAGYLLFQRGAALVAQPFDERTLTLSGEPQALTVEAAPGGVVGRANFSASDTGTLVFSTTNGGVRGRQTWLDRRGSVLGTLPQPGGGELLNVEISPDGASVAGTRMDPSTGNWDIWTVDVASATPTRRTRQPGIDSDAVWSPDGSELAYLSRRADVEGIFRMALADGREQLLMKVQIVGTPFDPKPTDWTSDGRFLLVDTAGDVVALPLENPSAPIAVVATPSTEWRGRVSPDGRWIAFESDESGERQIYVQPFPGPGARVRVSATAGHPRWGAEGREVFWNGLHPDDPGANSLFGALLTFSGNSVRAGPPTMLMPPHVRIAPLVDGRPHATATRDGQRFLLRQADGLPGPVVKVILNWRALLRSP
jgi:hypothetical protein